MRRIVLGLVGLGLALAGPAGATDTWTTPYTGVRHLYRTTGTPWRIHALEINLCARGVAVRATKGGEKWRRTSSFGSLVGAEAAVNGDFFSYDTHLPTGLAIGAGEHWHADMGGSGEAVFGDDHALLECPGANWSTPAAWMRNAVGGRPLLVQDGEALTSFNRTDCSVRHPRTAVGLSRDRQTLYLAVVDGRSSVSVGMTCRELATLMSGLGAFTAMNLDGGGSTTMWLRGAGVLNDPSDGSERTVSDHLAVLAEGSGPPGSCDWSVDEPLLQAGELDTGGTTDLDGDGMADVCARAAAGLRCSRATGTGFSAGFHIDDLSNANGFDDEANFSTLRMGDVNGDGLADACARGDGGVICWPSTGSAFGAGFAGPDLADDHGWGHPQYFTTLRLADFDGDGRDDLCARAAAGFRCYPSTGTGFGPSVAGPVWSNAEGWDSVDRYGTIRMGDVDGDGLADVCGRGAAGMECWRSTGAGFEGPIAGPGWSDAGGWDDVAYWSTIRLRDMDGDGRADLCARGASGFRCHLSTGDGFGAAIETTLLADENGWGDHGNYETLRLGDVDGDGRVDLCARANARVYCWLFSGSDFATRIDGPELSDASGWNDHRYYSTLRLADVSGDGRADVCARAAAGVLCWLSDGNGFSTQVTGPAWSDDSGWDGLRYYSTLRLAGPRCLVERCNGRDDDCDGAVDEGCAEPDGGPGDGGGEDGDGGAGDADGGIDGGLPDDDGGLAEDEGGATEEEGEEGQADELSGADEGADEGDVVGGCGCGTRGGKDGASLALLALVCVALASRRPRML